MGQLDGVVGKWLLLEALLEDKVQEARELGTLARDTEDGART